ncbi:hypothetical protein H4R34_002902, partial [Dimargaris verticillata]
MVWELVAPIEAIPALHDVNKYTLDGGICPLSTRVETPCPLLCVADPNDCPTAIQPDCARGQTYCQDGVCRESCPKTVTNPCHCGRDLYGWTKDGEEITLVPCLTSPLVDVPEYNYRNKTLQIEAVCAEELGANDVDAYGIIPVSNRGVWLQCPEVNDNASFTLDEPMWLALWVTLGGEAVLFALWCLYKRFRERNVRLGTIQDHADSMSDFDAGEKSATRKKEASPEQSTDTMPPAQFHRLTGYCNDYFGVVMLGSLAVVSMVLLVLLLLLTIDYYGSLTGIPFSLTHQSSNLSAKMFIVVWYILAVWLLLLNLVRIRIRNFFRLKADVVRSDVVQVEKELTATVLLNDHSRMLALLHKIEVRVRKAIGQHVHVTTVPLERIPDQNVLYFNYQYTRFIYSSEHHTFEPFEIDIGPRYSDIAFRASGLSQAEALERQRLVGTNFISVPVPSFVSAVAREFVGVFYLYQLIIIWLYYYYAYYQIGIVDTCVILISALVRVVVRLQSEKRLKSMAEHMDSCQVLRGNEWRLLATTELVPGDVFEVTDGQVVPCDSVVLSGNVIVNESSLTGEPLPVRKFAIRDDNAFFTTTDSGKNNVLYSGTTVSQADPLDKSRNPIAMVHRTGTATNKGQLIRNILFPNPISFIFDEQLKVVLLILAAQGVVMFGLSLWLLHSNFNASWFYGMISLAQLINPILPAALVVGQSIASMRLRKRKIFCVDLPRIMVAGKIQMFCFDKTGTLTKEGLEFDGVQPVLHQGRYLAREPEVESQFEMVYRPGVSEFGQRCCDVTKLSQLLKIGLASCHSVAEVNHQLIGNPVDIEMFRSSGWELRYPDNDQYLDTICHPNSPSDERVHVVKRYEFDHARASMSVAVLDPKTNHVHIFVKGSFEKVRDLAQPTTIPSDYDEITAQLARQGCYVLAMAHRDLGSVDPASLSHWSRDRMEEEIALVGLVLFKNNLKPDTADAIAELKQGSTRTVMITGDTALTGVFIARACGLAPANDRMLLGDVNAKQGDVAWTDVDTNEPVDLHQALLQAHQDPQRDVELAVTGKAFNIMMARDQIREYLLNIRVFARMTPQDKVDCVQLHMERGITAMCGDGGNDCGALRAAHVGLALSEAEASIVSPFSTSVRSIYSCVELMRQGRAALATSFAGYKYLILYGQTMAMMKTFTFYFSTSISQALWIVVDAFIT